MSQPFKIFRLPSLALDVVFDQMAFEEIFQLSKCSVKSQVLMKEFTRRRSYNASVSLDNTLYYTISAKNGWKGRDFNKKVFACNDLEGMRGLPLRQEIFKILDLFRPTTSLTIRAFWFVEAWVSTCSMLNLKLAKVVVLAPERVNIEQYKFALRTFKNASFLSFYVAPPEDMRLEDEDMPKFTCDAIDMQCVNWITTDNFFNVFMNCRKVFMGYCPFSFHDLYPIVEKWLDQKTRLEKIELLFSGVSFNVPPIEKIVKNTPYRRVKNVEFRNCFKTYPVGHVIQRSDRVEAVICCDCGQFVLGTHFETNVNRLIHVR